MSTLDKLKQKLHLDGAAKGLEGVNSAAKKVDMSGLGAGVEAVSAKFSALQVMGVTALANITNSAVNAGKRMIKALTLDPVTTGFKEYETQINATQTILANTSSKGTTIDDVNKALEELNKYADMTIYNFTEMTRNIGTFTAAGIDLETSVNAIQGIANLAAVSGSTSQQASTAMYQLSQALSAGTIRLMDWNSVVNAGMGGEVFQNALKETSKELGTGAEAAIKASGSFRESLKDGWLTADVLTQTLKKFTSSGANEYVAKYTGLSIEAVEAAVREGEAVSEAAKARGEEVDAIEHASKALAEKSGKNAKEIADTLNFAKTASDAATKVKTFTQLWDVLKESAQSGWSQTWKIIVGDFEEAKSLLTPLADTLTGFINRMSDFRNRILEVALDFSKPWTTMMDKLGNVKKVAENIGKVTDKLEYFQEVVNKVWRGDYNNQGDNPDRRDLLRAAGYDPRVVQDLVNKGYQYKLTVEDIEASHRKFGLTMETTADETKKTAATFEELTDQKLKDAGLTEDEIALYRAMEKEAKRLGISVSELADEMSKNDGRSMIIESFKNFGDVFVGIGKAAKQAWVDIFNPPGAEEIAVRLYGVIKSLKDFSEKLRLTDKDTGKLNENGEKILRTFKGVFAIIDVVTTVLGGGLKIAFKAISQILSYFHLDILDITAAIGDAAVKFRDWFESIFDISGVLDAVVPLIQSVATAISGWFASFKASEGMQNAIKYIKEIGTSIKDWWAGLKDAENLPKTIAEGIVNFFSNIPTIISTVFSHIRDAITGSFSGFDGNLFGGFIDSIRSGLGVAGQTVVELGKILLDKLNGFLSAHGFEEISADAIAGLVNGLTSRASDVWNAALEIGKQVLESIKDFLGIHSPSTEMKEVGTNTVDGFVLGIQNGSSKVWETIKGLFAKVVEFVKGIDFGAVLAGVVGIGIVRAFNKIANALEGFGSIGEGIGELLENTAKVANSFSKVLKGVALKLRAEAIKDFAIALGILVAAIVALAYVCGDDRFNVWEAVGVVGALAGVLVAIAAATALMSKSAVTIDKSGAKISNLTNGLIGIGIALLMVALTVKMIGDMDPEAAKQGFQGLVGVIAAIGAVLLACKIFVKGKLAANMDKVGKTIFKISVAMLLLIFVAKLIAGMEWEDMAKAAIGVMGLVGIIALLMHTTSLAGRNADKVGSTILKISIAMGLLVGVSKLIAGMSWDEMGKAAVGLMGLTGIIAALTLVTKLAGRDSNKIAGTILGIATAILTMALVTRMVAGMDTASLIKGIVIIALFGGIITGLIAATKLAGNDSWKIGVTILAVSIAIGALALVATLLGYVKIENLAKGIIAVGLLSGIMSLMIVATRGASECKGNIIAMVAAIGIMAVAVAALSFIDTDKLASATLALSMLMGMFALMTKAAGGSKASIRPLVTMVGVVTLLAGILYLLSTLKVGSTLETAASLSLLLVSMSASMLILNKISTSASKATMGALALTAMAVPLAAFVGIMALMQNVSVAAGNVIALIALATAMTLLLIPLTIVGGFGTTGAPYLGALALTTMAVPLIAFVGVMAAMQNIQIAMDNVKALTVLATAMTLLLIPLTLVGAFATTALLGVLALTAMAVPLVAFVGILALMSGIQNGITNAMALAQLMTAIGDVLFKISLVAPLAVIGVGALSAMVGLMTTLGIVATAIGALVTYFPSLQTFLDTGIPILERLASGLGRIIGSFITGFAGEVMSILPQLGLCLSQFMINLQPFVAGARMIDETVLAGVGYLSAAILALTVADLINGIVTFLPCVGSLADFGTQLSQFMINALPFIMTAAMITPEMLAGVKALAQTILILTAAELLEGLTSFITGGSSLETFATQLPILGQGIAAFATSLGAFSEEQLATVNCAAQAVKSLAKASSEIPNAGGLLGMLVGENDLGTFAAQFPILGTGLRGFLDNVGEFTDAQVTTVNCAAQAIKTLAKASSEIPNSGGWLAQIVGDNELGTFAEQFPALGTGLRGFLDNVGTLDETSNGTITAGANAVKSLAEAATKIPNEGGWVSKIVGDNNLSTFATQFPALGTGLKGFITNIGTFTEAQLATINVAVKAVNALAKLANSDLKGATKHLSDFGADLPDFASDIGDFCANMPSADSMSSAVSNLDKLLSAIEDIGDANSGCLSTFANNLKKVGKNAVDKFVEAFTSSSVKTDLKDAAKKLGEQVVDGIGDKEKAIKTAGTDAAKKAVDGVETQDDDMESAGKDLGSGLVRGINSKKQAAYDAGYALGQKAVQGEKDGQKSKSPSKLTILAGQWLGEGLVIGMGKMSQQVYNAGSDLGHTATNTISSTVSKIADLVNTDIDSQPTIRPVLDLSDVRSGVSSIGTMFAGANLIGVQANVSAISSMMSSRGQNGVNTDVVSAIDKLRKDLGNISSNTYSINGINVSEGTDAADAIHTLVRAIKMEGRS
jgi:tape measure domain-containing protein